MAIVFVFAGIGFIVALIPSLIELVDSGIGKGTPLLVLAFCLLGIFSMFVIPTISNSTPKSVEVVTMQADFYEDIEFDSVVTITYEKHKYAWWTYNAISSDPRNVKIITKKGE